MPLIERGSVSRLLTHKGRNVQFPEFRLAACGSLNQAGYLFQFVSFVLYSNQVPPINLPRYSSELLKLLRAIE